MDSRSCGPRDQGTLTLCSPATHFLNLIELSRHTIFILKLSNPKTDSAALFSRSKTTFLTRACCALEITRRVPLNSKSKKNRGNQSLDETCENVCTTFLYAHVWRYHNLMPLIYPPAINS